MSSAVVEWRGRCAAAADQVALLACFERLASAHRRYCLDGPGPRPEISRLLAKERGEGEIASLLLTTFDQEIEGRIAVCSDVVHEQDREALATLLDAAGIERRRRDPVFGTSFTFPLPRIQVKGLDFQLYDPRGLYPGEDRVSCVFLRSDALPMLDGLLAKVSGPERCARISVPHLKGTQWYIECPFVHLRDYLEDWLDLLLSWIKVFHVADLYYFHRLPMAELDRHRRDFEEEAARHGREAARDAAFEDILRRFEREADRWAQLMGKL